MSTISKSKNLKFLSLSLSMLVLLAFAFSSCTKNKDDVNLSAYIQVTNSADASLPQDFFVDGKMTASAVAYGQSSSFISTSSGSHQGQFKNTGTATANATLSLSLTGGQYYSTFYTDGSSAIYLQDDHTAPQTGKARVRFIHLNSAVSSNVDFAANGGAKLVSNLAYKAASAYYDVDPATAFSLYATGSSSVLLSIPATIQAGHIYTIYVSGATNATVSYHVVREM